MHCWLFSKKKRAYCFSIVVSTSKNTDLVFLDLIDQPVLLVDAVGPAAGQNMFERFGLADAGKRITLDFFDQFQDVKRLFPVLLYPPGQIFETSRFKFQAF